jgi:hypothetical protein
MEKVIRVFSNRIGEEFLREKIIDLVMEAYPETNRASVIPSDYCYNMVNAGINFDFHLFESLGEGQYRCLGLYYSYTGVIYWKGEPVGEWKDGKYRVWQNAPPNLIGRIAADQWINPR